MGSQLTIDLLVAVVVVSIFTNKLHALDLDAQGLYQSLTE